MNSIVACESQYRVSVQSEHVYTPTNVPRGYKVGDREDSHGLVQIHLPAHPSITKEEATNPIFAANFLAKNVSQGNARIWTCFNKLAINN